MMRLRKFLSAMRAVRLTEAEKSAFHPFRSPVINDADIRLLDGMDEQSFFTSAKNIRLAPHERVAIKEAIIARAEKPPFWAIRIKRLSTITAAFLILTVASSGLSYAAEYTVPGDVLYPMKIYVNEELASKFRRTPKDRAVWEVKRAERRLREARVLSKRGSTDASAMSSLEVSFERHARVVQQQMVTLKNEQRADELEVLATTFNEALKERTKELKDTKDMVAVTSLLKRVHSTRVTIREVELESLADANTQTMNARASKGAPLEVEPVAEVKEDSGIAATATTMMVATEEDSQAAVSEDAMVMLKTSPSLTMQQAEHADDELLIDAEARMNIARRKIEDMQSDSTPTSAFAPERTTKIEFDEAKRLLDRAEKEIDAGNIPEANKAASAAMETVREMNNKAIKTLQPQIRSSAPNVEEVVKPSVDGMIRLQ